MPVPVVLRKSSLSFHLRCQGKHNELVSDLVHGVAFLSVVTTDRELMSGIVHGQFGNHMITVYARVESETPSS